MTLCTVKFLSTIRSGENIAVNKSKKCYRRLIDARGDVHCQSIKKEAWEMMDRQQARQELVDPDKEFSLFVQI